MTIASSGYRPDTALTPGTRRPSSCRFCASPLETILVDLGMSPLANRYLTAAQLHTMEPFYPIRVYLCQACFLAQLEEFESPDQLFAHYAYFSSYSNTWLDHAKAYADLVVERFGFDRASQVIEVASNDGYLLQYFLGKGISVLGIEPAANVAQAALSKGIPTIVDFFGRETACRLTKRGSRADLLVANNVVGHVPNLNDFVEGLRILLAPAGVITAEIPHLLRLMAENQFDTIYHEHFSYFSFITISKVLAAHGLRPFDVEELPTHGGSLRIYACHADNLARPTGPRVGELTQREEAAGLNRLETYACFAERVKEAKRTLLEFLINAKRDGKSIVGYGAPAKGNTLLNYCGVRADFIDYTVDRSPHKQGCFLPGTHIPVHHPDKIRETRPHYLLILPWNLKDEIMEQLADVREWGCQFVVPIPSARVYP